MTEQEAIKILKINCICSPKSTEFIKASNVAIKALEKQIPKKPIENKEQNFRYIMPYTCPCCGGAFGGTGLATYCYHCGQKFDWSDEE